MCGEFTSLAALEREGLQLFDAEPPQKKKKTTFINPAVGKFAEFSKNPAELNHLSMSMVTPFNKLLGSTKRTDVFHDEEEFTDQCCQ